MLKEHSRFQLEARRLGRTVVFQVTVFERSERNGSRLYAETQCSDPIHFILQFVIHGAKDFEDLLDKFLAELDHRGFEATRYRMRIGRKWAEWKELAAASPGDTGTAREGSGLRNG